MSKRAAGIVISTPASKVRRRLNFGSPYTNRFAVLIVRVTKQQAWTNRPMNRKPRMYRMYRSPDVPKGCEGPCKVQSFESRQIRQCIGKVMCISDVTRGVGLTHRIGKRFCVKSVYVLGKIWMDENIKTKNHTHSVMFFLVRDRRPVDKPQDFGEVFNMFDNEPSTATVKNSHRDRYQVLRKWHATVTGGQYASKEQALVKKFVRVNNYVVYNQQEAGKYENHTENALMLYMACTHASNPVYATLKIRIYFYDSVSN
ncbi:coat protein [Cotton leaf curl Multan virus-[Hibiscus rosa-sinensis]]|uniref:Capsid protein n=1 Tax=Cotton leaf curl Multan virus-[Hibiscus rosa-sinensis] TaxID=1143709 RepID=H6VTT6_9GEMI|nr:coat protein [Cotton leaf curl Multan virus-[Hibiscus rosa-sinensis]]AFA26459.1 coat protein [Cotton leaf curl Multan virus-[Hibiscus rosa-sinensis]]